MLRSSHATVVATIAAHRSLRYYHRVDHSDKSRSPANSSQQVYQIARAQGRANEDGAAIAKVTAQIAGVTRGDERD
jgi:hypothetical protein